MLIIELKTFSLKIIIPVKYSLNYSRKSLTLRPFSFASLQENTLPVIKFSPKGNSRYFIDKLADHEITNLTLIGELLSLPHHTHLFRYAPLTCGGQQRAIYERMCYRNYVGGGELWTISDLSKLEMFLHQRCHASE